jgi:hypothetical protein
MNFRAAICLCLLPAAGCISNPSWQSGGIPLPSALFLDVAASPQWLAEHEVLASWNGRQVKLPACFTFDRVPNPITFGGFSQYTGSSQDGTYVEFGAMRVDITVQPQCSLTFAMEQNRASSRPAAGDKLALDKAGVRCWTIAPVSEVDQDPNWTQATPEQLRSRIAAGKVQMVHLDYPR